MLKLLQPIVDLRYFLLFAKFSFVVILASCATTHDTGETQQDRYEFSPAQRKVLDILVTQTKQWPLEVVVLDGYSASTEKALDCGSRIKIYLSDAGVERNRIYVSGAPNAVAVNRGLNPPAANKVLMTIEITERRELGDLKTPSQKYFNFSDLC